MNFAVLLALLGSTATAVDPTGAKGLQLCTTTALCEATHPKGCCVTWEILSVPTTPAPTWGKMTAVWGGLANMKKGTYFKSC